jgi:hypothetical protein
MQVRNIARLFAGTALLVGLASSAAAADQIIPGTGYAGLAGNGNTGTDAWGQPWSWNHTIGSDPSVAPAGLSAWGTPGLGAGTVSHYGSHVAATDFEISFVTTLADLNQTASPFAGGYNETTRFDVCSPTCVEWTPVFSNAGGAHEVDFFAPSGSSLHYGDAYFVNVVFSNGLPDGSNSGFSAVFTGNVPEPSTWAMMLVGLGGIGAAMRMARRRTLAAATA